MNINRQSPNVRAGILIAVSQTQRLARRKNQHCHERQTSPAVQSKEKKASNHMDHTATQESKHSTSCQINCTNPESAS